MAQLNFSFNTPNYISEEFGGNVLLSISFPSEGYHLVMIEASNDQENWSRIQSEVISLSKEFKFIAPSKSALYRIRCKDEPESATIQETSDSSALHNGILEVVNEAITPVAKTGMAADVNLTAIAGLVATQVQAAIAELLQKIQAIGAPITYEGQVIDYGSLPSAGVKKGHMYNVVAAHDNIPAGTNYVWNGAAWDPMTGQIDLSPFLTSAAAQNTYVPLSATNTQTGSDVVRLLAINGSGHAISITPKILAEHILKNVIDETLIAKS